MDYLIDLSELAGDLGIYRRVEFDPELLVPQQSIRALCFENKCGHFNSHYMCPPHVGSIEENAAQLSKFQRAILLQYSKPLDVENDTQGLIQSKIDFHEKILQLEDFARNTAGSGSAKVPGVWGLIGGTCELCAECRAKTGEPCPYPERARPSLEALAIDVVALLDRFSLDSRFHADRIAWTGCLLFGSR